jgi:hypothetical protein
MLLVFHETLYLLEGLLFLEIGVGFGIHHIEILFLVQIKIQIQFTIFSVTLAIEFCV